MSIYLCLKSNKIRGQVGKACLFFVELVGGFVRVLWKCSKCFNCVVGVSVLLLGKF